MLARTVVHWLSGRWQAGSQPKSGPGVLVAGAAAQLGLA